MQRPRLALGTFLALCLALGAAFGSVQDEPIVRAEPVAGAISVLFGQAATSASRPGPTGS